jgi:hypothetical protein
MPLNAECKIFRSIQRTSLQHFISFSKRRLKTTVLVKYLPELACLLKNFGKQKDSEWERNMYLHNEVCVRAVRMKLHPLKTIPKLVYSSVDLFLFQMHADKISDALDSLVTFAGRVVPLIQRDRDAESWRLNRKLLIHRHHWLLLSQRVMRILNLIRTLDDDAQSQWPGQARLRAAALQASRIFGTFASPHNRRSSSQWLPPCPAIASATIGALLYVTPR